MPTSNSRQAAREHIAISEHQGQAIAAHLLTDADLAQLDRLADNNILTCRTTRHGYHLDTHSHVGLLVLDRITLEIKPKLGIGGDQLITWLGYAAGIDAHRLDTARTWHTTRSGIVDLVVAALVAECRHLLRNGLHRNYVREDRTEPVLRGRLDLRAQVAHRYGMVDRLHVRTFDRQPDIWENQVCHAALLLGARVSRDPGVARAAKEVAGAFPAHPAGTRHAHNMLNRARYHRMNTTYRNAHRWAQLLFTSGGPADLLRESDAVAGSLLLNMDRLWEHVVHRMASEAASALGGTVVRGGGQLALTVRADARQTSGLRPDVLIRFGKQPTLVIPIDAKYKIPTTQIVGSDDLHQLLTYACAYPMPAPPRAMIVQPSTAGWTHNWVSVTGPQGLLAKILVIGVDTHQHPTTCGHRLHTEIQRLLDTHSP
jgi:5-methylcytosine-specific restriction enzyme subunit McrC